ncbi:MAG: hypothetical protein RR416_01645 [Clostridia bacterium]
MSGYSKLKLPKPIRKTYLFSKFLGYDEEKLTNTLPSNYSAHCYNFACKDCKLAKGAEIFPLEGVDASTGQSFLLKQMLTINGEKKLFVAKNNSANENFNTLVVSHSGGLDILPIGKNAEWKRLSANKLYVEAVSFFYKNKYVTLLSDGVNGVDILDGVTLSHCANSLSIVDMTSHNERVFAVVKGERNSLWFSASFDPFDWTVSLSGGGYINFDGSLGNVIAVKSLGENLFVFCEYGIYRLSGYVDQTEFALKRVYFSCNKIYARSIVESGEFIIFCASDGVYIFDGYSVRKKAVNIDGLVTANEKTISASYGDGKYFLSIENELKNGDYGSVNGEENSNCVLLSLAVADSCVDICRGVNLECLNQLFLPNKSYVVGLSNEKNCIVAINSQPTTISPRVAEWKVENIDFDEPNKYKIISAIEFGTECQYEFGIVADGKRRTFTVSPRINQIVTNCKGKKFEFFVKCDEQTSNISSPKLIVDFERE